MNRWAILCLLFAVRTCMGFQFQAVPALSPLLIRDLGLSVADVGLLIGLYQLPGIALALPGGAIGARYGDKRIVAASLCLMLAGGLLVALVPTWEAQVGGRLVAGIGGVGLNVLMTKMVADWFAGRELATAMGVFINSWPVGIALALVIVPLLASKAGSAAAFLLVAGVVALCFIAFCALYRAPGQPAAKADAAAAPPAAVHAWPTGIAIPAVLAAGLLWGLYNAGLGVIFGFGTLVLTERGSSLAVAASVTSTALWVVSLSVPAGGYLADRTGRPALVMLASMAVFAVLLVAATRTDNVLPMFIALGLVGGLSAAPIMSQPVRVLPPHVRAIGMGIFFTVFYTMQFAGPWMAGRVAAQLGRASAAFEFGALLIVLAMVSYGVFALLAARAEAVARPAAVQ